MRVWWVSPKQQGGVSSFWITGSACALARVDAALCPAAPPLLAGDIRHGMFTDPEGTQIDEVLLSCPIDGTRILTGHGGGATARAVLRGLEAHGGCLEEGVPAWFGSGAWTSRLLACQTEAQAAAVLASSVFESLEACGTLTAQELQAARAAIPRIDALLRERLVLLVGAANAGKSTLFNALAGQTRALVSPMPGTTRDIVEEVLAIGGYAVRVCDTAGANPSADALEQGAIDRMRARLGDADCVLHVLDTSRPLAEADRIIAHWLGDAAVIRVRNKTDQPCRLDDADLQCLPPASATCHVSARDESLGDLTAILTTQLGGIPPATPAPCTPHQCAVLDQATRRLEIR